MTRKEIAHSTMSDIAAAGFGEHSKSAVKNVNDECTCCADGIKA